MEKKTLEKNTTNQRERERGREAEGDNDRLKMNTRQTDRKTERRLIQRHSHTHKKRD